MSEKIGLQIMKMAYLPNNFIKYHFKEFLRAKLKTLV